MIAGKLFYTQDQYSNSQKWEITLKTNGQTYFCDEKSLSIDSLQYYFPQGSKVNFEIKNTNSEYVIHNINFINKTIKIGKEVSTIFLESENLRLKS